MSGPRPFLRSLAVLLLIALMALPAAAERDPATWNERVQEADSLLREGKYRAALRITEDLVEEMGAMLLPGENSERILGTALGLHALAEAGRGKEREADWHWRLAVGLREDLAHTVMSQYGEAGEFLGEVQQAMDGKAPVSPERLQSGTPVPDSMPAPEGEKPTCQVRESPVKKKAPAPQYSPEMRQARIEGPVILSAVLDRDGRLIRPVLLQFPAPSLAFRVAETVRQWTFEPARCDGRPIEVFYNLTVNMTLGD